MEYEIRPLTFQHYWNQYFSQAYVGGILGSGFGCSVILDHLRKLNRRTEA